jgi:hypothetical protein
LAGHEIIFGGAREEDAGTHELLGATRYFGMGRCARTARSSGERDGERGDAGEDGLHPVASWGKTSESKMSIVNDGSMDGRWDAYAGI